MNRLHTFDGQPMTVAEIQLRVPVLSERTIRRHLSEGRCTTQAMLAYDRKAALSKAGTKSAKVNRKWSFA